MADNPMPKIHIKEYAGTTPFQRGPRMNLLRQVLDRSIDPNIISDLTNSTDAFEGNLGNKLSDIPPSGGA
jgi:hypothetical protein